MRAFTTIWNRIRNREVDGSIHSKRTEKIAEIVLVIVLINFSVAALLVYLTSGLNLAYNDAMSHLNIARRVFDNLQPGLAQMGSVWLPLPHLLMLPTVWSTFLWHSGLSAAIVSMASYVVTGFVTYKTVRLYTDKILPAAIALLSVGLNINFLYIQTTALTEPLFMVLFALAVYSFVLWTKNLKLITLISSGFFVMLMTLTRYDGWFAIPFFIIGVFMTSYVKRSLKASEGLTIIFLTISLLGIFLWILYNLAIFGDPFYFAFGEFSARAQQSLLSEAGVLNTKGNLWLSSLTYYYAIIENIGIAHLLIGVIGAIYFFLAEKGLVAKSVLFVMISTTIFNILALYLGFSVIFVGQLAGESWFNVRYGIIVLPVAAFFSGYLMSRRFLLLAIITPILIVQSLYFLVTNYSVTIIDGTIGSSQKNVGPVGAKMRQIYIQDPGFILVSAASHDAILFRSGIELKNFIHEGVSDSWNKALENPELHAKYIIMRTNDELDSVGRIVSEIPDLNSKYELVYDDEFADIYKRRF